jgi:hypothetical protein
MVQGQLGKIAHKTPHLQNNQSKMDWSCGSGGRAPALKVPIPEFKTQSYQKN